jgi:hypothetical protein
MKKLCAFIALLAILTGCKKDNQPNNGPQLNKITSIERTIDGANRSAFSYDNQGRITENNFGNGYLKTIFDYTNKGIAFKHYNANNVLTWEMYDGVLSKDKLVAAGFRTYNNGVVVSDKAATYTYDAAGYLIKMTYPTSYSTLEYTNGNCTKVLHYSSGGTLTETITMKYYSNMPNKFNLAIFEYDNYLPFLHTMGMMGKANANLVQQVTMQNNANTRVIDYQYTTNADGYATGYSFSSSNNGAAPYSETYTINY